MYIMNYLKFALSLGLIIFCSCSSDEESHDAIAQIAIDEKILQEYFKTHYYNKKDGAIWKISKKQETGGLPVSEQVPLSKDPRLKSIENIKLDDDLIYKMYYMILKQGKNDKKGTPSIIDSVYTSYKGMLLDGTDFDESKYPIWFDLSKVVKGWAFGMQKLKAGNVKTLANEDFTFVDSGEGFLFIPSGMGYGNEERSSIKKNSSLIFKVSLLNIKRRDHDLDGVPTYKEIKIDASGNIETIDTDEDGIKNHQDKDDDGDGILTKNEITITKDDKGNIINIIYTDKDKDGIPDYLDYSPKK